ALPSGASRRGDHRCGDRRAAVGGLRPGRESPPRAEGDHGLAARHGVTFVQPFAIDFRYETEHVIAFCSAHPEFEAIEVFVGARRGRAPFIRAILTRHDMSQVDHINEEAVVRERRAIDPTRPTYFAPIEYERTTLGGLPRRLLRFPSFQGEPIVVDLVAAMPPDPAYGGLTDPMGHAPDVLPLMWRSARPPPGPSPRRATRRPPPHTSPLLPPGGAAGAQGPPAPKLTRGEPP